MSAFKVTAATTADIPAITSIFAHEELTSFMQLCLGSANAIAINVKQADRIAQGLQNPRERWLVARDGEHNKTASFVEWRLPGDEAEADMQTDEESTDPEQDNLGGAIPPGMNMELVTDFQEQVMKLRQDILGGKRHYLLMNLGTSDSWRRKGAATALVQWPFAAADTENVPVYLDTSSDTATQLLFEKVDFERAGSFEIDLSKYGGQGTHRHVAMIRWPKPGSQSVPRKDVVV